MKKRFLSMALAVVMILSCCPCAFAAEEQQTAGKTYEEKGFGYEHKVSVEPMRLLDFEMFHTGRASVHGFDDVEGGTMYPKPSWDGSTSFAVVGGAIIEFVPEKLLESGKYILSFDVKQNFDNGSYTYMRFNTDTGLTERNTFAIRKGLIGNLGNGWGMEAGSVEYVADTWRHVMMYMDFDKGTIDYVIDNEYVMTATSIPDMQSLTFTIEGSASEHRQFDNFTLFEFDSTLRKELEELGITMPENFSNSAELSISSKYYGNVFTTFDEVELKLGFKSNVDEDIVYDAAYVVKDYTGETVWTGEEKDIEVKKGQSTEVKVCPPVDKFDIYTLYASVVPQTEGYADLAIDREFSVVNTPTYGYKSHFIGHTTHPYTGNNPTRFAEIERLVDIAGIGFIRTDFGWGSFETAPGQYKSSNVVKGPYTDFYGSVAKLGIENLAILSPNNAAQGVPYAETEKLPQSKEAMAAWEKACEEFARTYKGKIKYIEFGNEMNFKRDELYSPEMYAEVCIAGYRGVKRGNPDAVVLTQGFSRSDHTYVDAMLEYTDEPMFDAVSMHQYQGQGSPEMCLWTDTMMDIREVLKKHGREDVEVWITEGNTSAHQSYSTDQQHAGNLIRQFVQSEGWNAADKFFFFEIQRLEESATENEHWFGALHGPNVKNANGAKRTYLAIANYIALTENAEVAETKEGDEEWFLRFNKPGGKSLIVMYGERKCDLVTLDIGQKNATLYDINGNPVQLSSEDGKYVISVSDQPVYLEYSGEKFEICDKVISADKYMTYTSTGTVDYNLTLPEGVAIEVSGKDNMTVESTHTGTKANIAITVNEIPEKTFTGGLGWRAPVDYTEHYMDDGSQIFRDYVTVNVKKNGKLWAIVDLPVEYAYASADVTMTIEPYDNTNTKYMRFVFEVKNNTSEPLSGTVELTSPAGIEKDTKPVRVEKLAPGATCEVKIQMPQEYYSGWKVYAGKMTIDGSGEEITFSVGDIPRSKHYSGVEKSVIVDTIEKRKGEAPKIDGVIEESEWKNYKISDFDKSQVSYGSQGLVIDGVVEQDSFGADADYGGMADFSGTVYAQWDEKYLYAAAVVHDDVHYQKQSVLRMYYDDHFYITAKDTMNQRHDTRIDIGLSEYYNRDFYTDEDRHGKIMNLYTPVQYSQTANDITNNEGHKCYVVRKGNATIYEVQLPWSILCTPRAFEAKQMWMAFNFRDYDGDRDKSTSVGRWFILTDTKAK